LRKWHDTGLIHFLLTPVLSHLLTLALVFNFVGGRHGGILVALDTSLEIEGGSPASPR
jgi:hypothetical protein